MKRISFRVDSSAQIGTGHIVRCLNLAKRLREEQLAVDFICREMNASAVGLIRNLGFAVTILPRCPFTPGGSSGVKHEDWLETDWLSDFNQTRAVLQKQNSEKSIVIVDHYALDARWEHAVGEMGRKVVVIDDLADRSHDCRLLIDQNLFESPTKRYSPLVPKDCETLLGPNFALLNEEYSSLHRTAALNRAAQSEHPIRRLLLFFGGGDPDGSTLKALIALEPIAKNLPELRIVVGSLNPYREQIISMVSSQPSWVYLENLPSLAPELMAADLFLGAGGTTSWERLCLGVPSFVISIAENQVPIASSLSAAGLIDYLGDARAISAETIRSYIVAAISDPIGTRRKGLRGWGLVDGNGAARCVDRIKHLLER